MLLICEFQLNDADGEQIYREADAPFYFTGNKILIGVALYNIALFIGTKRFYVSVNK